MHKQYKQYKQYTQYKQYKHLRPTRLARGRGGGGAIGRQCDRDVAHRRQLLQSVLTMGKNKQHWSKTKINRQKHITIVQ